MSLFDKLVRHRSHKSLTTVVITLALATQLAIAGDGPIRRRRPVHQPTSGIISPSANGQYLTLPFDSLEKEFLIHASLIPQTQATTSEGTLSRVVFFRRRGNKVFLMESPRGHVVTNDLPSQLILAEIPVVETQADALVLDFNAGMRTVFTASNWYGSDFSGKLYNSANRAEGAEVAHSFIESIESKDGTTEIRQIVQLNLDHSLFPSYEVRYYISPNTDNPHFQPRENTNIRQVGFFETAPVLETTTGRTTAHITRWNISNLSQPIKYFISANTPPEYVQAIKEGILYWNKAFGREVLQAEIAPAGVTAPTSRENIVQWVPWDSAGFAYADALSKPDTGEILHAQVYLTSVFAFSTKEELRRLLRTLQAEEEAAAADDDDQDEGDGNGDHRHHHHQHARARATSHLTPALKFLRSSRLCSLDLRANMVRAMERLLDSSLDESAVLRLSQDMIRSVVAHEIGHTLGLRHNFAGKLISNLTFTQRDQIVFDYLTKAQLPNPDIAITSSVMDYLTTFDDLLVGAQILQRERAFPYDETAIQVGYSEGEPPAIDRSTAPLFCTDSGLGVFADCDVFTSGARPIANNAWEITNNLEQMPNYVINRFIAAKAARDVRDRQPFDEVVLRPDIYASRISKFVARQLVWLNSGARSAFVERRYPQIGPMNFLEVQNQTFLWVDRQIQEMGGVKNVFFSLLPLKAVDNEENNGRLLSRNSQPTAPQGVRLPPLPLVPRAETKLDEQIAYLKAHGYTSSDGTHFDFSEAELTLIKEQGTSFFKHVEEELLSQVLDAFLASKMDFEHKLHKVIDPDGLTGQVEKTLAEVANSVIFAANENDIMAGTVHLGARFHPSLVVPVFTHSFEVRMKAAQLLQSNLGAGPDWSLTNRRDIAEHLIAVIENYIGKDLQSIKIQDLERPISQWFMEQQAILNALMSEPGCEDLLTSGSKKGSAEDREERNLRGARRPILNNRNRT